MMVLVDDWGWYHAGFHGNEEARTLTMDGLVKDEGLLLERVYAYKFCSPTRRSFLTGRFPPHSGQSNGVDATVDYRMTTIAETLGDDYSRHAVGKWHAGHFSSSQLPVSRGFDSFLGYFNGKEHHFSHENTEDGCAGNVTDLWDSTKPAAIDDYRGTFGDYIYADKVVDLVKGSSKSSKPLFVYWAMQCAHDPMEAPDRFVDVYQDAPSPIEYAFLGVVDEALSNFTEALRDSEMWDTSLVVVQSDNGGPAFSDQRAASNYPLRGGKYTLWEGGLRVNALLTGGLLPARKRGQVHSDPLHVCDWFATFARLAGKQLPLSDDTVPPLDSLDQWDALVNDDKDLTDVTDDDDNQSRVFFVSSDAVIVGQYKLIRTDPGTAQWTGPLYPKVNATGPTTVDCSFKSPCLFDVVADPSETTDLATTYPAVVHSMNATLTLDLMPTVFEGIRDPRYADVSQADVCRATNRSGNVLTPGDYYDDATDDDDDASVVSFENINNEAMT